MPWIRSFRHLGLWVAFTENDYHEMSCQSFGFTQAGAESRVLRKLDDRYPSVTTHPTEGP